MPRPTLTLKVAHKLGLAACAFAVPVVFIVWALVAEQNVAIRFAAQEVVGARYLAALAAVQGEAATASLAGAAAAPRLAETLAALEASHGATLDTAGQANAAIEALRDPAGLEAARTKLRELIVRIGDRSNLILDNVLATYYLTDVVLNRLPYALDRLADLTRGQANGISDVEARAQFLVGLGSLVSDLEGIDASIASAEQAAGGEAIRDALDREYRPLRTALGGFVDALKTGRANAGMAKGLVAETTSFSRHAAQDLTGLLEARVAELHAAQVLVLGITALLFGLAVAATLLVARRGVTLPLARLNAATLRLANGDLDTDLPPIASKDEVGAMAGALAAFKRQGIERRRLETAAAATHARSQRQQAALERHTSDFGESVTGVLGSLGASARAMREAANGMAHAVERTRAGSSATASGAEESSRNLAGVAAATEELTASVDEIARQVAQAAQAARDSVERAEATGSTVRGLSEAVGQIGDVARLIADIASKTNLLALNATIEAARAGEAGKGFAVVASEVKLLATQTARATEQISAQIAAIQTAAGEAVGAVHGVGEAIMRMDEVAAAIAAAVEEQGAATREIAASVQAVSRQNDDATRAMRDVSDMADSATGSSQVVLAAGDEVARVSGALQEEVAQFFAAMRSTEGERRRWERISGGRARISLRPPHGAEIVGELDDISGGGASAVCTASLDVGAEVEVRLPGAGDVVPARVVRSAGRNLGVAFRQDPTSLARIDRAMDAIASLATVHAAA